MRAAGQRSEADARPGQREGRVFQRDDEIAGKNRVTWNRWMASQLTDDLKTMLLEAERC